MFTVSHDHQMLQCPSRQQLMMERSWKPHVETAPNCPRCASSNTKFCYYNNYSFSQPRYFCKGCRRYWTKGGSLRNVPVGGGCRKSRRSKSVRPPSITTRYSPLDLTSSSSNEDSNAPRDSTIGSGIDLAAVFAKFLNQNSSSDHTELTGLELPDSGHVSVKVPTDHAGMETQKPSDLVTDSQLQEVVSVMYVDDHKLQQQQEERIQEFTGPDNDDPNNVFGLQALLSDDQVVEDALWSEATALPSFTWQPMVQFQEFDQTLSCDGYDQMKSSMNPMSDCWGSSFDLPSYELFSRP